MDERSARDAVKVVATVIGEIMEDHAGLALTPPAEGDWPARLRQAGQDIASLADAVAILRRRASMDRDAP